VNPAHPPMTAVRDVVTRALAEDLEPLGDVTAALLPPGKEGRGLVVPRSAGVLAGRPAAEETLRQVDTAITVTWHADDGDALTAGRPVGEVAGPLASILTAERTALNLLCHLSGIATATRRWVDACAGRLTVWDTRKTTPGLRALEKAAVRAGGGANHRGNLSEWVLLKDNHLAALGITEAVRRARQLWPGRTVQVEADRMEQLVEAIGADADIVLLDNMTPDEVRACVAARGDARRPLLEISGGVTFESLPAYVDTGADLVSAGALTASSPALDLGLDLET
jgi:nicotinate-nucleotide pyrophosphorylase (carboxylating)